MIFVSLKIDLVFLFDLDGEVFDEAGEQIGDLGEHHLLVRVLSHSEEETAHVLIWSQVRGTGVSMLLEGKCTKVCMLLSTYWGRGPRSVPCDIRAPPHKWPPDQKAHHVICFRPAA